MMVRDSFRAQCVRGTYWECLYFIPTSIAKEVRTKVSCTACSTDHRMSLRPGAGEVAETAESCGHQEQEHPVLASLPLGAIFQGVHNFSFALKFKYFIIIANFMHSKMNFPLIVVHSEITWYSGVPHQQCHCPVCWHFWTTTLSPS